MHLFLPQLIAQRLTNPALGPLGNTSVANFFGGLIPALIGLGFVIGAIVFLFMLITGAISWITSGGDKMRLEAARSKITNALVGIIILLAFFAILNLVECFFGIGLRRIEFGQFNIGFAADLVCPGGGDGGDGNGDGNVNPPVGAGECNCPCGGGAIGYYAQRGQFGSLVAGGECWQCTSGGWSNLHIPSCPAIICVEGCQ